MPIVDCGFSDIKEASGRNRLIHFGPTVLVNIGFDTNHDYANTAGVAPKSQASELPALIDTGASESCIDSALAESINLPVIDRQTVCGVGGETEVNVYLGHIHIPSIGFTQWGRFAGVLLSDGGQAHMALIGRTMLSGAILVYDGFNGNVSLAV